jgi:hypothetical protein
MFADINSHVKYFSLNDPDQFSLRVFDLVVQAPQNTLAGPAVIVLDKINI